MFHSFQSDGIIPKARIVVNLLVEAVLNEGVYLCHSIVHFLCGVDDVDPEGFWPGPLKQSRLGD